MMGAIIGDIVGSVYEWHNIKTKEFPFFRDDCFFTDDTVMTVAVADALMNGGEADDFIDSMKKYGRMYPHAGYGGRFGAWLHSDSREPYNSWGNGSAMRVSPVGFFISAGNEENSHACIDICRMPRGSNTPQLCCVARLMPRQLAAGYLTEPDWDMTAVAASADCFARRSAEVTHNHPEGIKGACSVADGIMFIRYGRMNSKSDKEIKDGLKQFISDKYGYDLGKTLDEIRPNYFFNESCMDTVPQAFMAFLESCDFEDAIRNAISLGGDSDTLAAITGGLAEAAYGIPGWIKEKAWKYLDEPIREVCRRWKQTVGV